MTVRAKIKALESRCFTEREQLFEEFFKDFFSWNASSLGSWIVAGIFEFFLGVFMWIPGVWEMELLGVVALFSVWGAMSYLSPYLQFQEGVQTERKTVTIYEKIQYLPISRKELQVYRTKKLAIFCFKMFLVFMAGQCFFALVVDHAFGLTNILYVVIWGLVFPLGLSGIVAIFAK